MMMKTTTTINIRATCRYHWAEIRVSAHMQVMVVVVVIMMMMTLA